MSPQALAQLKAGNGGVKGAATSTYSSPSTVSNYYNTIDKPQNSSGGIGGAVGRFLGFDITPGFNIDAHAGGGIPFVSKGNGSTGIAPAPSPTTQHQAAQTGSTTTYDPTAYGGYGSAAAQSAANNAYNTYKGYANTDLGKLLNSYGNEQQQINSNYDTQGNELQSGFNAAQAQNKQAVDQQNMNLLDEQNSIRQGVHQAYQNALNILGALGAGGSSAALNWAPMAASDFQNIQVGNANKNTAANLASLASNFGTYEQNFGNEKKKLADARTQDLNNAASAYDATKTALQRIIDGINAQNMTPSDVATGLTAVEGQIPNMKFSRPSYTGVTPVLAAPQLSTFEAPALKTSLTTSVPDNSAATPALYFLSQLQNQKKQQNQPVLQPATPTLPSA